MATIYDQIEKIDMSIEWHLPHTYESDKFKSYNVAKSLINKFARREFQPPAELITSIESYFISPGDATIAMETFADQINICADDFVLSNNAITEATLTIAMVIAWASTDTENRQLAFIQLTRHSWWVENLWVEVALVVADTDANFKAALLKMSEQHFSDAEKEIFEKEGVDPINSMSLDEIWHGHSRDSYCNTYSWSWTKLLATLDSNKLFQQMNGIRSLTLINRILDSPEFDSNYALWEQSTLSCPVSFECDGSWNGKALLPSLVRYGSSKIIHITNGMEHSSTVLVPHARRILDSFVETLSKRIDFEGLFKRWGTWLTRQHLSFPNSSSGKKVVLDSQDIFWALSEKVPQPFTQQLSEGLDDTGEPWIYQSMLALLHSNSPERFPPPDVLAFVGAWNLTPTSWNSWRGKRLRSRVQHFHPNQPDNYACRVLGYSIALNDSFSDNWIAMWNSSVALREILEFRPAYQISQAWRPADASKLMRMLVDIGLGILECTANANEKFNAQSLQKTATLFQALWDATSEMLSIDIYGNDFWILMQQYLATHRTRWTLQAKTTTQADYSDYLDQAASPSTLTVLTMMSSNPCAFFSFLPMLVAASDVPLEAISKLINQADIDVSALEQSAAKYERGPERKFKIHPGAFSLIERLAKIKN